MRTTLYQVVTRNYFGVPVVIDTFRSYIDAFTYAEMISRDKGKPHEIYEVQM